jgi:WASH complex subunit strumpellin
VIGRIRTDDLYDQMNAYPQPEHRSHALSSQASQLYLLLFFKPDILHNEQAIMREIVDKFFPDNWIITLYMGKIIINLAEAWDNYKAARNALGNTLNVNNIKLQANLHCNKFNECLRDVKQHLNEGFLTKDYLLTHLNKVLILLRQSNYSLKWAILHGSQINTPERTLVVKLKIEMIFFCLLNYKFIIVFVLKSLKQINVSKVFVTKFIETFNLMRTNV